MVVEERGAGDEEPSAVRAGDGAAREGQASKERVEARLGWSSQGCAGRWTQRALRAAVVSHIPAVARARAS
jgi:hypothetical protein